MKHNIPLGTPVSFVGDAQVHIVDNYQELLGPCPPDCKEDHDCYIEPYICIRVQHWTAKPLSQLKTIFDENGKGRPYIQPV